MFDTIVNIYECSLITVFLVLCCSCLKSHFIPASIVFTFCNFCFIEYINHFSTSAGIYEVFTLAGIFIYLTYISNDSLNKRIILSFTPLLVFGITNIPFFLTCNTLFFSNMDFYTMLSQYHIPMIVFLQIFHTIIFYWLIRGFRQTKFSFSLSEMILILLFLFVCWLLPVCIEAVMLQSSHYRYYLLFSMYGVVLQTFFLYRLFMIIHQRVLAEARKDMEIKMMQAELSSKEQIMHIQKDLYQIRHDLKHYLEIAKDIPTKQNEELQEKLQNYKLEFEQISSPVFTPILAFNYALNHIKDIAKEKNIDLIIKINITNESYINDVDLYLLLSNIFDNAIQHIGSENKIRINAVTDDEDLTVKVSNSVDNEILDKNGEFKDSVDSYEHGFGLKTIHEIVSKYDGILLFEQEFGEFCVTFSLPLDGKIKNPEFSA